MSNYLKAQKCAALISILILLNSGCNNNGTTHNEDMDQWETLTEQAYIYALPVIMSYKTMYMYAVDKQGSQYKAPFNQIKNTHRVYGPKDIAVVSANSDTPYSLLWMDLRSEPMVLTVPKIDESRYYSVMLQDLGTYLLPYIGSRTTGNNGGSYLVASNDWTGEVPDGIESTIRSSSDFLFAVFRTQLISDDDLPNVIKVQDGYSIEPLSQYRNAASPDTKPLPDFIPWVEEEATGNSFIKYLNFCLQYIHADEEETNLLSTLKPLGVSAGQDFDFASLPDDRQKAIQRGVANAVDAISAKLDSIDLAGHTAADYNHDWLLRAAVTQLGWGANDPKEASYPVLNKDASGNALDASSYNYSITFSKNELPPVKNFWSLTMYDAKTQLMIENVLDRYILNSPMLSEMTFNEDGSLTLYLQKDSPGKEKESNWLPAPDGTFYMLLRLYGPEASFFDGTWEVPQIKRANS